LFAGRYAIVEELGRGGMGVVYRAIDRRLGRSVALKRLRDDVAHREGLRARFVVEAEVTARLQHPAIIPVYELDSDETGEPYYTMRLVEGMTLQRLVLALRQQGDALFAGGVVEVAGEGWSLFRLLQGFVQLCRAMANAHEQGVLHRDLKPENVMVGRFGEVYIMDWGMAVIGAGGDEAEVAGEGLGGGLRASGRAEGVVGTPAYMAPEQMVRGGEELGARADVFALGGVLYFVLTGLPPREGSAALLLAGVETDSAPDPAQRDGRVPGALGAICLRALERDSARRTESAEALARELEDYLQGRSARAGGRGWEPREEDAAYLRDYQASAFRRPSVTIDLVLLARGEDGTPWVWLHRRDRPPFYGCWALPGTFVELEASLEDCARGLLRRHGLPAALGLTQLGAFGEPGRDPRTRVITVAFGAWVGDPAALPQGVDVGWFGVRRGEEGAVELRSVAAAGEGIEAAFDHGAIIGAALERAVDA